MTTLLRSTPGATAILILLAACDRNPAPSPATTTPLPTAPAPEPPPAASAFASAEAPAPSAGAPVSTKPDAVSLDSLKAGLGVMTARIVAQLDGYRKIEP